MIIPTLRIPVSRAKPGEFGPHGEPLVESVGFIWVAPVKLKFTNTHTTVRTDSSGTHGQADETVANIVLLVRANEKVDLEDLLVIHGYKVKVSSKHPRYTPAGRLDHWQLECVAWA